MTYNKKSIEDVEIKAGEKVFVRCDFNVPMKDGVITSDKRIVGALPTIKYLMEKGAKVILASHMGKPHSIFTPNFKLDKKEAAKVAALPEAERKRLALVLLLLNPKRVLLLDEPFRGLDVESAFMLRQLILQLGSEGRTVLVAARLAELDGICDDFYVLGGGVVRGRYEHYEFARAVREAAASGIAEK